MARGALLSSVVALLAFAGTAAAHVDATPSATPLPPPGASAALVFNGHGWGHGVGMSQWGADGYAKAGWDYRRILAHYFPGTTIGTGPSPIVRVLLLAGRRSVTLRSASPWRVSDGAGTTAELPPGSVQVGADLVVGGRTFTSPATFSPGTTPLLVGGAAYRGRLELVSDGKQLQLVNALPLESYLLGVVGSEMPPSWPPAALEAQAVAARSYALSELENVVTARAFDLYVDSEGYGGVDAETRAATAAVSATAHQVVLYDGAVATTYYSSSSGGRTESAQEAFGKAVPYLVSVPDPYDTLSPYHDWGPVVVGARAAAKALKVPGSLVSLDATPGPSGHVERVRAVGTGGSVELTGAGVRSALGLRSSWFSVGLLSLAPPPQALAYGDTGMLTGVARGAVGAVALEQRSAGTGWRTVLAVTPGSDGSFTVGVAPAATTEYRLAAGATAAAAVTVRVAPRVSARLDGGAVHGSVQPALDGAAVQLQHQDEGRWTTVATATTGAGGAFAVAAALAPGAYRVRCVPGHGLSPGVSDSIET